MFYMIGQCLLAPDDGVIIVDEPELHLHKAILADLWDAIEAARPDCAFLYITHDLDFVAARPAARKLCIYAYAAGAWKLEPVPEDTGLPERMVVELIGARRPALFVEGKSGGLDTVIYRGAFPDRSVTAAGNCDAVIHATSTFRAHESFHRLGDVAGIIDADGRESNEIAYLEGLSIKVLPTAEVENLLLLPGPYAEIAHLQHLSSADYSKAKVALEDAVFSDAAANTVAASARFASRQVDRILKRTAPGADDPKAMAAAFQSAVAKIDIEAIARDYETRLTDAIRTRDLATVLKMYDNKGLLSIGARLLGLKDRDALAQFVSRALSSSAGHDLVTEIRKVLPKL